jgi:hypothetical protein
MAFSSHVCVRIAAAERCSTEPRFKDITTTASERPFPRPGLGFRPFWPPWPTARAIGTYVILGHVRHDGK